MSVNSNSFTAKLFWNCSLTTTNDHRIIDFFENPSSGILTANYALRPQLTSSNALVWKVELNGLDAQDEYALLDPVGVGSS